MPGLIFVFSTVAAFFLVFPVLPGVAAMPSIFEAAQEIDSERSDFELNTDPCGRDGVPGRRVSGGSR